MRGHGAVADGPVWPHHWAYNAAVRALRLQSRVGQAPARCGRVSQSHAHRAGPNAEPLRIQVPVLQRRLPVRADRAARPAAARSASAWTWCSKPLDEISSTRASATGDFDAVIFQMSSGRSLRLDLPVLAFAGHRARRCPEHRLHRRRRRPGSAPQGAGRTPRRAGRRRRAAPALLRRHRRPRSSPGRRSPARSTPRSTSATENDPRHLREHVAVAAADRLRRVAMNGITSRFVLLIATAGGAAAGGLRPRVGASLRAGPRSRSGSATWPSPNQIAARVRLYFDNNLRVLASVGSRARAARSSRRGSRSASCGTTCSISRSSARSRSSTRRAAVRATSRTRPSTLTIPDLKDASGDGRRRVRRAAAGGRRRPADDHHRRPAGRDADRAPAGSSPRSPSKSCGAWSTASGSAPGLRAADRTNRRRLVAHGNPDEKGLIAAADGRDRASGSSRTACGRRRRQPARRSSTTRAAETAARGRRRGRATRTGRSSSSSRRRGVRGRALARAQLLAAIALALLGTIVLGWLWGRSFIQRIFALTRVTHAIAEGRMDERVDAHRPATRSAQLGDAFNSMADRLVRAAGGRPQAGTPGDVRPHRRRPGPRPLAPDPEHRQQLQADSEDVRRRRVPRDVQAHGRARAA